MTQLYQKITNTFQETNLGMFCKYSHGNLLFLSITSFYEYAKNTHNQKFGQSHMRPKNRICGKYTAEYNSHLQLWSHMRIFCIMQLKTGQKSAYAKKNPSDNEMSTLATIKWPHMCKFAVHLRICGRFIVTYTNVSHMQLFLRPNFCHK